MVKGMIVLKSELVKSMIVLVKSMIVLVNI